MGIENSFKAKVGDRVCLIRRKDMRDLEAAATGFVVIIEGNFVVLTTDLSKQKDKGTIYNLADYNAFDNYGGLN